MGMSSTAILFWGLCSDEEEEHWKNIGRDEEDLDYYNPFDDNDDDEPDDEDWEEIYATKKGLHYPSEPRNEYWDAKRKLVKESGCEIGTHCSFDYGMPYIAITESEIRAYQGCPEKIETLEVKSDWEQKLREFCGVMGIKWSEPRWWIVSLYG
ncbi:hypothetical protein LCGC14_0140570 [marine sediment metagenome]|uniref:Uncharacterized protein n=1 Tax=marine sediment metagenome TaxID=412755 RepID=A0A0F9XI31_9ZZZZ